MSVEDLTVTLETPEASTASSNVLIAPTDAFGAPELPAMRLAEPQFIQRQDETSLSTPLGDVAFFKDERRVDGRDGFLVGSALTYGPTTAGVSVTYEDQAGVVERSDVFLDVQVSGWLSLGVSGTIAGDNPQTDVRQNALGLNASLSRGNATFQGSLANGADAEPVIGLSLGFDF